MKPFSLIHQKKKKKRYILERVVKVCGPNVICFKIYFSKKIKIGKNFVSFHRVKKSQEESREN